MSSSALDIAVRAVAALIMVALPIAVAVVVRRWPSWNGSSPNQTSWKIFGMGALCFVVSQIIHVPLLYVIVFPLLKNGLGIDAKDVSLAGLDLVVLALVAGLMAGLCEEGSRWMFFRSLLKPQADSFPTILMFGTGHGGCEAILVGLSSLSALVTMYIYRHHLPDGLSPEDAATMEKQVQDYWAASNGVILMAPLERVFAMTLHMAMSLLVWRSFVVQTGRGLTLAILFHTSVDAVAVLVLRIGGVYITELLLGLIFFPLALLIVIHYGRKHTLIASFEAVPQDELSARETQTDVGESQERVNTEQE
uniref:YhfC family intramembrane metalloprotease n=1 Tax=Entomoneis paludosa TaxID=265537 RepID=A0A7S2Y7E8_9STRA|mmetsp:Transcript_20721/g.43367  ORF Transcript_20721/g.43367 Transcript_20721/m.43367 type:complete len:307 (+) Transcript_20721:126-1046(+)